MKIGEFAKVCGTGISVLRYYDKQNLLKPEYIDGFTGYRYYSQEQIPVFFRITALKQAGFSLTEIRELLVQLKSDADILELFDKKKAQLLETICNLDTARELIMGGKSMVDVNFYENADGLWAKCSLVAGDNLEEIRKEFDSAVMAQNYQRISAVTVENREVKCQVFKLNNAVFKLAEDINLPFENDEKVIGKWEVIGEYAVKEDFFEEADFRQDGRNKMPREVYFLPNGERYWCFSWTKGKFLNAGGGFASVNDYEMEEVNGERFMFVSFKSYDYRRGGKPSILVLKQIDNVSYSAKSLAKKDDINKPFIDDPRVIGKWKTFDFIYTKEEFSVEGSSKKPTFFSEIEFFEGGSCTSIYGKDIISGDDAQVWTKGYVLRKWNSTACEYEIRTVDGKDYLIIEWKSGDYLWGGFPTDYYVFVRA